jgi:hypothetical protein
MTSARIDYWRQRIFRLAETACQLPLVEEIAYRNRLQKAICELSIKDHSSRALIKVAAKRVAAPTNVVLFVIEKKRPLYRSGLKRVV